jgi:hypothetical protein
MATYIKLKTIEKQSQNDYLVTSINKIKYLIFGLLLEYILIALNLILINIVIILKLYESGSESIRTASDIRCNTD